MTRGLRFLNVFSKLSTMVGIIAVIASSHNAFAGTVAIKGREAGTFVTANFTYDGASNAGVATYTGDDNIGGPFSGQDLEEYSFTGGSCTAPDSSVGTVIVLVQATRTDTYNQGQLYAAGVGAADGTGCVSDTTGRVGATLTLSVTGGTGKFANTSGSLTTTITAQVLAAPGSPPGSLGLFGARQVTRTGSVTY
jgi:hypothetical protein